MSISFLLGSIGILITLTFQLYAGEKLIRSGRLSEVTLLSPADGGRLTGITRTTIKKKKTHAGGFLHRFAFPLSQEYMWLFVFHQKIYDKSRSFR